MTSSVPASIRSALAQFYAENHLVPDHASARSWELGIGPLRLDIPNFGWRREAITLHDIHHLVTGYPSRL
jgi:hypothetical protein